MFVSSARHILQAGLDFLFPGSCAACNTACEGATSLCPACRLKLDSLSTAPLCAQCSYPLAYSQAPCPRCRGEGVKPFDRLVALGVYEEPLSSLIQSIKYRKAWEWTPALSDRLIATRRLEALRRDSALLVPIPLHPLRHLVRGYNQAWLIADHIGRKLDIERSKAIIRVRHTPSQTLLHSRAKRDENLKGAFALEAARYVRNRHVILVDDVTTTGATLRAAATAIRAGRPASISACVLAIADPKHRSFASI
jgi:ComF family protein